MSSQSDNPKNYTGLLSLAVMGLTCLVIGGLVGSEYQFRRASGDVPSVTGIAFPIKVFTDTGEFVSITGRLAGEGLAYKNNVETITCYKDRNECEVVSISQIGPNLLGGLYPAQTIPITAWGADVITASDSGIADPITCYHNTINIDRSGKVALIVQEPANQTSLNCQHAENKIYKWTIERSLWEEKAHEKSP